MNSTLKVVFVCLGNICRSPMAEGIFQHLVKEAGLKDRFEIDSAGTSGYHDGELADPRMRHTAERHGMKLTSRSRKFIREDFERFDYIIAMDRSNHRDIEALRDGSEGDGVVHLMRDFDPEPDSLDVPDPYYGGEDGFEKVYRILRRSCETFLSKLTEKHAL